MDRSDKIAELTALLRNVSLRRQAQLEATASRETNESSAETAAALTSSSTDQRHKSSSNTHHPKGRSGEHYQHSKQATKLER
jgi:hypothetical protein